MATKKTRITISLDPRVYEAYKDFAAVQGIPPATAISSMLTDAYPAISKTVLLFRAARESSNQTRDSMLKGLAQGIVDLKTAIGNVVPDQVIFEYMDALHHDSPRPSNTGASNDEI